MYVFYLHLCRTLKSSYPECSRKKRMQIHVTHNLGECWFPAILVGINQVQMCSKQDPQKDSQLWCSNQPIAGKLCCAVYNPGICSFELITTSHSVV